MVRLLTIIGIMAFIASPALAKPIKYACKEESGGWCESDGKCYLNYKPPATYVLILKSMPGNEESTIGLFTECRLGKCGMDWVYRVKGYDFSILGEIDSGGETLEIDRKSGQFVFASTSLASVGARANSTFGHCTIVDK